MCKYVPESMDACGGQEKKLDPLELELTGGFKLLDMGTENWA